MTDPPFYLISAATPGMTISMMIMKETTMKGTEA
jgi:hypothetical protein